MVTGGDSCSVTNNFGSTVYVHSNGVGSDTGMGIFNNGYRDQVALAPGKSTTVPGGPFAVYNGTKSVGVGSICSGGDQVIKPMSFDANMPNVIPR